MLRIATLLIAILVSSAVDHTLSISIAAAADECGANT
jgi:hypothetical protein